MAGLHLKLKSRFLLWSIAKALLLPPVLVWFGVLRPTGARSFPAWLRVIAYIASVPLAQYIRGIPTSRARRRDMQKLQASPIPRVKGWLPGNLDVLWNLVVSDGEEYCAETMRRHAETYGPTFDMGILWASQVRASLATPCCTFFALDARLRPTFADCHRRATFTAIVLTLTWPCSRPCERAACSRDFLQQLRGAASLST